LRYCTGQTPENRIVWKRLKETVKTSALNLSAENSINNTENENSNDNIVKAQSGEQNNSDLNNSFIYSGYNRRIFLPHSKEVEHP
jgi:hypothetical protein